MKRHLLLCALFFFSVIAAFGQLSSTDTIRCYTVEYHEMRMLANLKIPSKEDFEKTLAAQVAATQSDVNNGILKGVLKIPVIVHVVHFGEPVGQGANIAAQQVYSQIEVMNEDFRRKSGTLGFNEDPRGADTEIEFVPALYDPSGKLLPEPGINRYKGPLPAYVLEDIDLLIKPATIFDPTRYLNMWTVNFAALLLGYAQFPDPAHGLAMGVGCDTGGDQTDGVVMGYQAFGSRAKYPEGTYHANYDLGRTVTHEVGHWLGLRHIWGDGGCGVDDYCGDTPFAAASNSRCPKGKISCGSLDMIENYMDYTYDNCMNIFTKDQALRMRIVLTKSARRRELLSSTVHLQPVALDAAIVDILSPRGQRCNGNLVPEVVLRNLGQQTLTAVTINYQVDGGSVRTFRWTGSLATGAMQVVQLPAISASAGKHTLTVSTTAPNGGADAYTFNDKWADEFIISNEGDPLNFFEGFEGGLYPPSNKWVIENEDHCESWSPYSNIVGSDGQSTTAVYMNYFRYSVKGSKDGLQLPLINMNTTENSDLEFDVAYSQTGSSMDKLQVFISVDCGATFYKIYEKAGAALATAPEASGAFRPVSADQWRKEVISLNNYRTGQVLIRFVATGDNGDNIFLDNIRVTGAPAQIQTVQLKKFTASSVSGGVELQWQTASEENYKQFDVERSSDGVKFEYVESVAAKKGNSTGASYKTVDPSPFAGTTYYRLKIVRTNDLNPLYSQVISIKPKNNNTITMMVRPADNEPEELKLQGVYPNPSNGAFDVTFTSSEQGRGDIRLMNANGSVAFTKSLVVQQGINKVPVAASGLAKGVYILVVQTPNGLVREKVMIK